MMKLNLAWGILQRLFAPTDWPCQEVGPLRPLALLALVTRSISFSNHITSVTTNFFHFFVDAFDQNLHGSPQLRRCLPCWVFPTNSWCFRTAMVLSMYSSAFHFLPVWTLAPAFRTKGSLDCLSSSTTLVFSSLYPSEMPFSGSWRAFLSSNAESERHCNTKPLADIAFWKWHPSLPLLLLLLHTS